MSLSANRRDQHTSLLIIEDNDDHWQFIQRALRRVLPQATVTRATNEEQAYNHLRNCLIDEVAIPKLILLDLYLPTRAIGWQLLSRFKELGAPLAQIPVLILSNSNVPEDIIESYRRGALAYLVKPMTYTDWLTLTEHFSAYWLNTVALVKARSVFDA